jgi:Mn2+/Fe2+ NRAMP family transporter
LLELPEPELPDLPELPLDDEGSPDVLELPERLPLLDPLDPDIPESFELDPLDPDIPESRDDDPDELELPERFALMSESGSLTFGSLNDEPVFWFELCEPRLELLLDPLMPDELEFLGSPRLPESRDELCDGLCDDPDELFRLSVFLFRLFDIRPPALRGALTFQLNGAEQCLRCLLRLATSTPFVSPSIDFLSRYRGIDFAFFIVNDFSQSTLAQPVMKKIIQVGLGIVTGIGGFLEIGSVATSAQAGAAFGYQLIWALVVGVLCLSFLVEMSGRFAAVSKHTVVEGLRDRFGFGFFSVVLAGVALVVLLVLMAELGGVALALQMATDIGFPWWALPVLLVSWLLIWKTNFDVIENGSSILGLLTLCFAVAVHRLHPDWGTVIHGAIPSLPSDNKADYWFICVSILGASITPYLMYFYSSGAVEDKWDRTYLGVNKIIAFGGMAFGGLLAIAVLIIAARVLHPQHVDIDKFDQMANMMLVPFPKWGRALFAASMAITCLGAALEIALAIAYMFGQGLGWNSTENKTPAKEARFSMVYTVALVLAALPLFFGADPLKVTNMAMALTSATLPLAIIPFLILMNDPDYLQDETNGVISNSVVVIVMLLSFVLAIVSIPLQVLGG